jgi:serine/threonine protein kinase
MTVVQVVHGDIKLDNIVITKDLKNVAICDFGTAGW